MTRRHVTTGQHTGNTNLTSTLIFNVIDAYLRDSLPSFVDMTENKEFIKLIYCLKSTVTDFPVGNIFLSLLPPALFRLPSYPLPLLNKTSCDMSHFCL